MRQVEMRGPLKGFSNFVRSGEVKNLIAMNNHTALFTPIIGTSCPRPSAGPHITQEATQ